MGLLGTIGNIAKGAADIATDFIPGPIDDIAVDVVSEGVSRLAGNGGGTRGQRQTGRTPVGADLPDTTPGITQTGRGSTGRGSSGQRRDIVSTSPVDFGPVQFDPGGILDQLGGAPGGNGGNGGNGGSGGLPVSGGGAGLPASFQDALGQMMLKKAVRSKSGRAILEAMQSGALQQGMIQQTVTVQTPRGTENHSPPGFRTVYINDQPYAVFKPLAKTLGLLPKRSKAKITSADMKSIRSVDRLTKKLKKLAKKTGRLKVKNK